MAYQISRLRLEDPDSWKLTFLNFPPRNGALRRAQAVTILELVADTLLEAAIFEDSYYLPLLVLSTHSSSLKGGVARQQ